MPLDHHGRAVVDILPLCIRSEIPKLGKYLDSRFMSSSHLEKVNRVSGYKLKEDNDSIDEGFYINCIDLWPDSQSLIKRVLNEKKGSVEIKAKILDLPYLLDPESLVSIEFM